MAKVTFASLKMKATSEVKTFTFGDKEIEVIQYLPSQEKDDLLSLVIQNCSAGTVIDTFAMDCLFHTYLVISYTNVTFTDKQKENIFVLYDILETNGFISAVLKNIPESEYDELRVNLLQMVDEYAKYRNSARAVLEQFNTFAPDQSEQLMRNLEELDIDKIDNLISVADRTGYNLVQ